MAPWWNSLESVASYHLVSQVTLVVVGVAGGIACGLVFIRPMRSNQLAAASIGVVMGLLPISSLLFEQRRSALQSDVDTELRGTIKKLEDKSGPWVLSPGELDTIARRLETAPKGRIRIRALNDQRSVDVAIQIHLILQKSGYTVEPAIQPFGLLVPVWPGFQIHSRDPLSDAICGPIKEALQKLGYRADVIRMDGSEPLGVDIHFLVGGKP